MSQDGRIELIRRALDAWNRRDIEDLLAISTPEIEYVNSPTAVEPGTRRGPQEVTAALQAQWEILLDARQEIDRMVEHGDAIFTLGRVSRRMPGSEARIEQPVVISWKIRAGKLAGLEILGFGGDQVEEALRAAGLDPGQLLSP
jgi:ketosteroid isomerase-like protein